MQYDLQIQLKFNNLCLYHKAGEPISEENAKNEKTV